MRTPAPAPSVENNPAARNLLIEQVRALLDTMDKCMVVADRQVQGCGRTTAPRPQHGNQAAAMAPWCVLPGRDGCVWPNIGYTLRA